MNLPPPPKAGEDHIHTSELASDAPELLVKARGKSDDALTVNVGGASNRSSSPALSIVSINDAGVVRLEHNPDYVPGIYRRSHPSRSPAPPSRTLKGRFDVFWTKNKGLALVLFSQFFGVLMSVATRKLEVEGNNGQGYHPFQILFARMSITVVCASVYMYRTKTEHFPFGMKEVRPLLVARGLTGFFGVFGLYYSLLYLPLADATVISFLAPSLACWACSYLIHEPFTRMEQISAYISLFGVVLIARPISFFSFLSHSKDPVPPAEGNSDFTPNPTNMSAPAPHRFAADYDHVTPAQRAAGVGVAMIGVLGAASAYTTIRWIGKRAHPLISVNYFSAWCTIVSVVMMLALPGVGFLLPKTPTDWAYLLFLGICGFVMQFLLAAGLQYEKSSRATNMVYTQMLFALAFDKLVFGTTPSTLSIIGSSLILGSAIYVALHKGSAKEGDRPQDGGLGEEERGLMTSATAVDAFDDEDEEIPMRSLR